MHPYPSDVAFTPAVKALQEANGSRAQYAAVGSSEGWSTEVSPDLEQFLGALDMFYLATATKDGQPYVQYRGGALGFLKVLDPNTLAFADFRGNQQFISAGNLSENPRAFLFLMDYETRRRVKVWGTAEVSLDEELIEGLADASYGAGRPERAIVFRIAVWSANCPQHIHRRVPAEDAEDEVARLRKRVAELEEALGERSEGT